MGLTAWLKAATMLITLLYNGVQAFREYDQRQRGKLELMLELRRKRDQEKAKANAVENLPLPPDDASVINRL